MNPQQELRAARAAYIDARLLMRSSPAAYWQARYEYLYWIRAIESFLDRPRARIRHTRGVT